jgi:hypothetical protein
MVSVCWPVSRDLSRSTRIETEGEESKRHDKPTGSDEMIHIPAMFLGIPVVWDGFRSDVSTITATIQTNVLSLQEL